MWIAVFIPLLLFLLVILRSTAWARAVELAFSLPGPPALPILGNIFMVKELWEYRSTAYLKYGSIIRGWLTFIPVICIIDPKHVQQILGNAKHSDKTIFYSFMHTFLGDGLITSSGYKWRQHRKCVQPYFHINILKQFIPLFVEAAQVTIEQLVQRRRVKIGSYVNEYVLNILHEAVLGIPFKDKDAKMNSPFRKGQTAIIERIVRPWLLINFVYKLTFAAKQEFTQKVTLQEYSKKILDKRRNMKGNVRTVDWCFLDGLIEISQHDSTFNDDDIINEACTLMLAVIFAGQDSTAAAIALTLYNLAKHQDAQEKVFQETCKNLPVNKEITLETLNRLKYLEQCIKESLRLYPSVPIISRKLSEDVCLADRHVLPKGCNILIAPYATHRLSQYFPDPDKFDPNRFSTENSTHINSFTYFPFSVGARNCAGYKFAMMQMKVIISAVIRNYKIFVPEDYNLEVYYRITIRAKGGIPLILERR